MALSWRAVTQDVVVQAMQEYDRMGPDKFFAKHGFGPTTTCDLWKEPLTRPRRSWAPHTSSRRACASPPLISKAASQALFACSRTWASRFVSARTLSASADCDRRRT